MACESAGAPSARMALMPVPLMAVRPTNAVGSPKLGAPEGPGIPCGPCGPVAPCGNVKLSVWLGAAPVIVAEAGEPGVPVTTVPMVNVLGGPCAPSMPSVPSAPAGPVAPVEPVGPGAPVGMVRLSTWLGAAPVIDAAAGEPGAPVTTVPMVKLFGGPAGPEGKPKFMVGGSTVLSITTVAELPGGSVVVTPTT